MELGQITSILLRHAPPKYLTKSIIVKELSYLLGDILDDGDYVKLQQELSASDWVSKKYLGLTDAELEGSLDDLTDKHIRRWAFELAISKLTPEVLYYWSV